MNWAYVIENDTEELSNQSFFCFLDQIEITDEQIIFEQTDDKPELKKLIPRLEIGDKLIIRSATDLADDIKGLINVFQILTDKQIELYSCEESFLSGVDYLSNIAPFNQLYTVFKEKKQKAGYKKACSEGRVGRPPVKRKQIEQALQLYKGNEHTLNQITALTGVSKTTLYRALKEQKGG